MPVDSNPCRCLYGSLASILLLPMPQTVTRYTGTVYPPCSCWGNNLLAPFGIVPDDQRLATLDVFLVVSHQQSASDPLILSFFGCRQSGDTHGNVLGGIMQQARASKTTIS